MKLSIILFFSILFNQYAGPIIESYKIFLINSEKSNDVKEKIITARIIRSYYEKTNYNKLFVNFSLCPNNFDEILGTPLYKSSECEFITNSKDYFYLNNLNLYKNQQEAIALVKEMGEFAAYLYLTGGIGAVIKAGVKKGVKKTVLKTTLNAATTTSEFTGAHLLAHYLDPLGAEKNKANAQKFSLFVPQNFMEKNVSFHEHKVLNVEAVFKLIKFAYEYASKNKDSFWKKTSECTLGNNCYKLESVYLERLSKITNNKPMVNYMMDNMMDPR